MANSSCDQRSAAAQRRIALDHGLCDALLFDLSRSVLGPKYSGAALRKALLADFGERRLADARHRVVIPAVDVRECRTKVFKTPHAQGSLGDGALRVVDVAMAACAAPAYFPSVRIGKKLCADGGQFAVAPDVATPAAARTLIGLAKATLRAAEDAPRLRRFFDAAAPAGAAHVAASV